MRKILLGIPLATAALAASVGAAVATSDVNTTVSKTLKYTNTTANAVKITSSMGVGRSNNEAGDDKTKYQDVDQLYGNECKNNSRFNESYNPATTQLDFGTKYTDNHDRIVYREIDFNFEVPANTNRYDVAMQATIHEQWHANGAFCGQHYHSRIQLFNIEDGMHPEKFTNLGRCTATDRHTFFDHHGDHKSSNLKDVNEEDTYTTKKIRWTFSNPTNETKTFKKTVGVSYGIRGESGRFGDERGNIKCNFQIIADTQLPFEQDSGTNIITYANQGLAKLKEVYGVSTFVGLQRKLTINGREHIVRVVGEEHDTITGTNNKAALTFELVTLLSDTNGNALKVKGDTGNNYNYTHGILHASLNGGNPAKQPPVTAYDMLPAELKSGIKNVTKSVGEWDSNGNNGHYVNYPCNLFPLTATEIGSDSSKQDHHTEGTIYQYGMLHNNDNYRKKKDANGHANDYGLVSPSTDNCYRAGRVDDDRGGIIDSYNMDCVVGVSFAFCI